MTVETGSFSQIVDGLIGRANKIFSFPNEPLRGSFQKRFSDQIIDQTGYGALWRTPQSKIQLRISATTRGAAEQVAPLHELVAPVVAPRTVLRLTVSSFTGLNKGAAFFLRNNYPGEVDLKVHGPAAIKPATEYLALLEESLRAGTLTFPDNLFINAEP